MSNWNAYCPGCYPKFNCHSKFTRSYNSRYNSYDCYSCSMHLYRDDFNNEIYLFKCEKQNLVLAKNNYTYDENRKIVISALNILDIFESNYITYEKIYSEHIIKMFKESDVKGLFDIVNKIKNNMLLE